MNITAFKMMKVAGEAGDLLKTIANPHRLVMLCQLLDGEKSVGDLAASVGIRDSAASQNLSLLRRGGIVEARRDGQTMWYSIRNDHVRLILETLYKAYCAPQNVCSAPVKSKKAKPRA